MQQEQHACYYRNDEEYLLHTDAMTQQGWVVVHIQRNFDSSISATWQRSVPMPIPMQMPQPMIAVPQRPIETMVQEYRSADEFSRNARKLAQQGWVLVSQSAGVTRTAIAKNIRNTVLTLGVNRITPGIGGVARKTTIVATYQRQR